MNTEKALNAVKAIREILDTYKAGRAIDGRREIDTQVAILRANAPLYCLETIGKLSLELNDLFSPVQLRPGYRVTTTVLGEALRYINAIDSQVNRSLDELD
jgi:hypothetical protein